MKRASLIWGGLRVRELAEKDASLRAIAAALMEELRRMREAVRSLEIERDTLRACRGMARGKARQTIRNLTREVRRLTEERGLMRDELRMKNRHDCDRWRDDGLGCAQCNPVAARIRDCWDDPVRKERDVLRSEISEANRKIAHLVDRLDQGLRLSRDVVVLCAEHADGLSLLLDSAVLDLKKWEEA